MTREIDMEQVGRIARLARIELAEGQARTLAPQLGSILEYFDKLQELDTEGVEPMAHAVENFNVLAEDIPHESLSPAQALANAPARDEDYFMVPKVIGQSQ